MSHESVLYPLALLRAVILARLYGGMCEPHCGISANATFNFRVTLWLITTGLRFF